MLFLAGYAIRATLGIVVLCLLLAQCSHANAAQLARRPFLAASSH
jgi:hypothetical protein